MSPEPRTGLELKSPRGTWDLALAGFLAAGLSCSRPTETRTAHCPQSHEFPNGGCGEVSGRVLDSRGQPLARVDVRNRTEVGRFYFLLSFVRTDDQGYFRLRITCQLGCPLLTDSARLWIVATAGPSPPAIPTSVFDSVAVLVPFAAVGAVPEPVTVAMRLLVP